MMDVVERFRRFKVYINSVELELIRAKMPGETSHRLMHVDKASVNLSYVEQLSNDVPHIGYKRAIDLYASKIREVYFGIKGEKTA